jgi:hypothetical protein
VKVRVKVIPRAREKEILKLGDGSLKVKLTAPPVDGKANKQLIELIAEYYKVKKSQVTIVSGEKSRNKIIYIDSSKSYL